MPKAHRKTLPQTLLNNEENTQQNRGFGGNHARPFSRKLGKVFVAEVLRETFFRPCWLYLQQQVLGLWRAVKKDLLAKGLPFLSCSRSPLSSEATMHKAGSFENVLLLRVGPLLGLGAGSISHFLISYYMFPMQKRKDKPSNMHVSTSPRVRIATRIDI